MVNLEGWDVLLFRMFNSAIGSRFDYIIDEVKIKIIKVECDLYRMITI